MNITITGDIGAGKSVVAKELAKRLNMRVVEAGELYREYAKTKGLDVLQQNQSDDYSIDREIDTRIAQLGKDEDNIIFVSRTAWHFVPNAIKIYLAVNPILAAKRVTCDTTRNSESHTDYEATYEYNLNRKAAELKRYKSLYNMVDPSGKSNSDIIVVIGKNTISDVCDSIQWAISTNNYGVMVDPKTIIPTQSIRDFNMGIFEQYCKELPNSSVSVPSDIKVNCQGSLYCVEDGHHRVAAAVHNNIKFLLIKPRDKSVDLQKSMFYDWEDMVKVDLSDELETYERERGRYIK